MVIALLTITSHALEVFHSDVNIVLLLLLFNVALVVVSVILVALCDTWKRTLLLLPFIGIVRASICP